MSAVIPEGSVVITPTEMYREMLATHQAVRDVAGKLDSALGDTARRLDGVDKSVGDHENRIRLVEQQIAPMADHESRVTALEMSVAPIADHKTRLPAVEKKVWTASGVSSIAAAAITAVATLLAVRH